MAESPATVTQPAARGSGRTLSRGDLQLLRGLFPPGRTAGLIALGVLVALLEAVGLVLLVPLLALVGIDAGGGGTAWLADGAGRALAALRIPVTLASVLLVYVAVVAVQAAVVRAEAISSVHVRETVALRLRAKLYGALSRMRWTDFIARHTSHYVHALTTQLDRVYTGVSQLLLLLSQSLVALVYLALALRLAPVLSLVAIGSGAMLAVLSRRHVRGLHSSGSTLTDATTQLHATVVEHLANMKVAKSFGAEARHVAHFETVSGGVAASWSASGIAFAGARSIFSVGSALILAVIVYAGVELLGMGSAAILLLLYVFGRLVPRLGMIQQITHHIVHALPAFRATADELERCERATEPVAAGASRVIEVREAIRLEHAHFSYDGRSPVLTDLSLEIPAGSITAIVGASGAGKTTIADLLLGLTEPSAGRLTIDGTALARGLIPAWRRSVAYVPQETVLFNDSIRNNLLWAVPDADAAGIDAALTAAGARFVFDLPMGLDTQAGERGGSLSGGERQRIALARALLRRPRLLVLDEPTSGLDPDNEARVLNALSALRGQLTILIISHRPSAVEIADRVYSLERGSVVDARASVAAG